MSGYDFETLAEEGQLEVTEMCWHSCRGATLTMMTMLMTMRVAYSSFHSARAFLRACALITSSRRRVGIVTRASSHVTSDVIVSRDAAVMFEFLQTRRHPAPSEPCVWDARSNTVRDGCTISGLCRVLEYSLELLQYEIGLYDYISGHEYSHTIFNV